MMKQMHDSVCLDTEDAIILQCLGKKLSENLTEVRKTFWQKFDEEHNSEDSYLEELDNWFGELKFRGLGVAFHCIIINTKLGLGDPGLVKLHLWFCMRRQEGGAASGLKT
ncbi:hypothetical protein CHS0354_013173 [Potamilus streckersoni]|uniref:Uncharacterized protein n=1 Tax=Potamilus streckersoni TaxID=2493646 RepID=A0AAE0T875_9BIVA|nr:hypothetical protein CHS0354_013173 [Potamilus streckersoni]